MPFKLTLLNDKYDSLTFPNGLTVRKEEAVVVPTISKSERILFTKYLTIEEIAEAIVVPPPPVVEPPPGPAKRLVGEVGYVWRGLSSEVRIDGIKGIFQKDAPRFDLTEEELVLAATTAGILELVENHS